LIDMPNLKCQNCGRTVRLAGMAALCPYCGQLVSAQPIPAEPVQPVDPLADLGTDEHFVAAPLPREFLQPRTSYKTYYLIGGMAAGIILLLATVAILTSKLRQATPPPPPVVVTPPAPKPARPNPTDTNSGWFSENPTPPKPVEPERRPASRPVAPPPPHAELARLRPSPPPQVTRFVNDEQIGNALVRGTNFLIEQFTPSRVKGADQVDPETFQGLNALAVYALLHAGQSLSDPRLTRESELVKSLLDRLKDFPMTGDKATYSRSLRISALTVFNRPQDKAAIDADIKWLLQSSMGGAYTYSMPEPGKKREDNNWDNSNSQYGALGLWAAAEAGFKIPVSYWNDVEQHWQASQLPSGGWAYRRDDQSATLAMTCAGATMLFVARDQIAASGAPSHAYVPLTKAQQRAMEWFDEGDHSVRIDSYHRGYTLYGLERVGLATGYKYFGTHDWYVELAAMILNEQKENGSWEGGDGTLAETAFALLFLARGRHPVFINKLQFEGAWSNRPRDVEVLTRFAGTQLERQLNWEIADISREWWSWFDSPLLYISSDRAVPLKAAEIDKLRSFALAGGLIFTHAERDNEAFSNWAAELASKAFPEFPFQPIDASHPVFSTVYPQTNKPPLRGVNNGVRLLMLHSPQDLARWWQPFPPRNQRVHSEIAINIGVYASGRRDLRNRIASPFVPQPSSTPVGTVPVARLQYSGNWEPEPMAWTRAANLLHTETGIALKLTPTQIADLKYENAPIAHLTGTEAFTCTDAEASALRLFVTRGGILLIDACGGSKAFADSIQQSLLRKLFLDTRPTSLDPNRPPLKGDDGDLKELIDLSKPRLRPEMPESAQTPILTVRAGNGQVLFMRLDLTAGLLGTSTVGISGYQPSWCEDFVRNVVLWTISRLPKT
jgi:hypothetical protein